MIKIEMSAEFIIFMLSTKVPAKHVILAFKMNINKPVTFNRTELTR